MIWYLREANVSLEVEHFISGGTDSHGNEIQSYEPSVEVAVFGISPIKSSESTEGETSGEHQNTAEWGWTVYAPHGTDIRPKDRVTASGQVFEVLGEPEVWTNGPYSGNTPGQVHHLKRYGEAV